MPQATPTRSPRQQKTLGRLLRATRDLAAAGGYAAVTMNAMAERAGVTRMTAYQYFRNRDHALAELIVVWGAELAEKLALQPAEVDPEVDPVGAVQARFRWVIAELQREPKLLAAVMSATATADPDVLAVTERLNAVLADYVGQALGHVPEDQRPTLIRLLGYLFQSVLGALATGKISLHQAQEDMVQGMRLMTAGYRALVREPAKARQAREGAPAGGA